MKIAYLDCASGISGDMTLGALVDAGADLEAVNAAVGSLGLPGVRIVAVDVKKHGFRAKQITIEHEPEHKHRHLHHIDAMIDQSALSPRQRDLAKRIFLKLGQAEAKVHGTTLQKVHFHEVGAVDSIADIVGTAVAFDLLGIEQVACSPIPTGTGFIEIAHGRVSLPAPATGELLTGIPLAGSNVEAELTTPTGAAIVATLAEQFGPPPAMTIEAIGYGAGQRDLAEQPNLLRVLIGTAGDTLAAEALWMVETNLDDASGEFVGYCLERLWEQGALDVYTTPIQMKKNRPAVVVSVLCRGEELAKIEQTLFRETTTLGVRRWPVSRSRLERRPYRVETPWGPVDGVLGLLPGQPPRFSPEFESCRALAHAQRTPLRSIYEAALKAFDPQAVVD
ncbi:MAG: nickel pincer cofactor biosynthesis protein LarC [Pirellulales bacterium]